MKNTTIGIILVALTFSACGQQELNCNQIRKQSPHIVKYKQGDTDSLLALDISTIRPCLNLDAIDKEVLHHDMLAVQIAELNLNKKTLTYGIIIDHIGELMSTEQYRKSRKAFEFANTYQKRKVNKSDSVEIRRIFKTMGLTDSDLNALFSKIYSEENSNLTYGEAFDQFSQSQESTVSTESLSKSSNLIFGHFARIESRKQLTGQLSSNKPLLLYFTEHKDIEGRKMEEILFQNQEIQNLLTDFNCFMGSTDDKSEISSEQQADFEKTQLNTKGQYIAEIKKSISDESVVSLILIVDKSFEPVDSYTASTDLNAFIHFLERNKNVR